MTDKKGEMTRRARRGLWDAAARTTMETSPFRVRLGTARPGPSPGRTAPKTKLSGRIKAMVRMQGGLGRSSSASGGASARRYSSIGRGGHAGAQFAARSHRQRVTVKARVVRHKTRGVSAYGGGSSPGKALRKHVNYLEREGAGESGERALSFNSDADLTHSEALELTHRMEGDRHHFRFIVSPEEGGELDLKTYARELVGAMEQDLGTRLEWLGVAHYNTDNPHLHLLVRGRDAQGGDLVIHREYLSYGMRAQAMEIATRHLGPRLAVDIERSLRRDLAANRLTALDLSLAREAEGRSDGLVSALRRHDGTLAHESERLQKLARLAHLEALGLASERATGVWRLAPDLVARLRTMGSEGDIIKRMHARMRGSEPSIATVIFSKERAPTEAITGRVFDRGVEDELYDRRYLMVEGRDGKAYYVPLSEYSERPGMEADIGAIVTVSPVTRTPARAADKNLERFAREHAGLYDPAAHTAWVEGHVQLPPGVSAADYVHSHVKRAKALASRGLIEALDAGRYRIPEGLAARAAERLPVGRDSGSVLKVERHSALDLSSQVGVDGVTWLDQELARAVDPMHPPRPGATRFERELAAALKSRAERLSALGLAELQEGRWRSRAGFLDALYERELKSAAQRLSPRYGQPVDLPAGARFAGKVSGLEQLPSGPHALIAEAGQYALVPSSGRLADQLGRPVQVSVGRARSLTIGLPTALQQNIRFQDLELTRSLKLRR